MTNKNCWKCGGFMSYSQDYGVEDWVCGKCGAR